MPIVGADRGNLFDPWSGKSLPWGAKLGIEGATPAEKRLADCLRLTR
jgi:hypothetical protein